MDAADHAEHVHRMRYAVMANAFTKAAAHQTAMAKTVVMTDAAGHADYAHKTRAAPTEPVCLLDARHFARTVLVAMTDAAGHVDHVANAPPVMTPPDNVYHGRFLEN